MVHAVGCREGGWQDTCGQLDIPGHPSSDAPESLDALEAYDGVAPILKRGAIGPRS
jgi:hypothetical protein